MAATSLTVFSLVADPALEAAVDRWLAGQQRYRLQRCQPGGETVAELERHSDAVAVLLVEQGQLRPAEVEELRDRGLLLPAVVIGEVNGRVDLHEAEVHLPADQLEQLSYSLDAAVSRFLARGLRGATASGPPSGDTALADRWRLADRLKDRLGLAGVFYKRDPSRFLRHLPPAEASDLLQSLKRTYRDYLVQYFHDPAAANQALESFVNTAFFSDLPITKSIEIHIDLIDYFAKQLKLEGRNEDFLQDYRLALLDVLAHLCEMYRRSMPPDQPMQTITSVG